MKKLMSIIAILLIVTVVGFAGGAYWSGKQVERWYRETLAEASKHPNLSITTVRYDRGLFSSQAITRYQLVMEGESGDIPELSFSTREHIYHGPLPVAGWSVPDVPKGFAGAVVRQTLDTDSNDWTRELARLYAGREPLVAVAQIGFDGASDTRIKLLPLKLGAMGELESIDFSGLEGQFQIAPHGSAIRGNMVVSHLAAAGKAPTASEGSSAITGPKADLRDLTMSVNQSKGAFDLMFGDSRFKVGELRLHDPGTDRPIVFSNLAMEATVGLSAQNPQQANIDVVFNTEKFVANPWSGTGNMRLTLHNLDGAAMRQLEQWQQKISANPGDPQLVVNELFPIIKTLLNGKPEFVLDTQAKLNHGDWQGKLTLNFQDYGDVDPMQDPMGLISALAKGSGEMTVSKPLAEALLTNAVEEEFQVQAEEQNQPLDQQAIQTIAAQQAMGQIKSLVDAGFLRFEGDRYRIVARFAGGKLFINDKELPLDEGAGGNETIPVEPDGDTENDMPAEPEPELENGVEGTAPQT